MFTADLVSYLEELRANNNKPWFEANRRRYEGLRAQFVELVEKIIDRSAKFDPALADLAAKDTLFRINRDIRFSKDKSPYKTTFSAAFSPGKKDSARPGYYLCINADDELLVAAGLHQPPPAELLKVRQAIAANGQKLESIVSEPAFRKIFGELEGEKLKTMPREFPAEHPYAAYLRHRDFTVGSTEQASSIADDTLAAHIAGVFGQAYPLIRFLREAVGAY